MEDSDSTHVPPISRAGPPKPVQPGEENKPAASRPFESYMKTGEPPTTSKQAEEKSPFDLAGQGRGDVAEPTHEALIDQMSSVSSMLGDLQNKLNNKNLNLRQSQKYLLRKKLTNANELIRGAAGKAGVDPGSAPTQFYRQNPMHKFMGLLTDSQKQLAQAQESMKHLGVPGQVISPGELLLMQTKLTKAQQELEYSSVLLSTAVSGFKTLFNIQI